jgi:hypothetical protein
VEFLVSCTAEIEWNPSSFYNLVIPAEYKKILLALVEDYLSSLSDDEFDDAIPGTVS